MSFVNPAVSFNFMVTMWDVQGPGFFGIDAARTGGWGVAGKVASGVTNAASQLLLGAFSEVSGLTAELELEDYVAGGVLGSAKHFVKGGKYPPLVLKRGLTFTTDLWDWHQQVLHGSDPMIRKSGIILLLDRASLADGGAAAFTRPPVAAWYFERALPNRLTGPLLDAKSGAVAIEQVDMAHEGLTRVSLGAIPGLADAAAGVGGLLGTAAATAHAGAFLAGVG